jgi:hypothetical protein
MIATIPSEATRGARAVRDGPKYGGLRGGAPGGTEEVGCDASPIAAPVPGRYHTGDGDTTPTQSVSAAFDGQNANRPLQDHGSDPAHSDLNQHRGYYSTVVPVPNRSIRAYIGAKSP